MVEVDLEKASLSLASSKNVPSEREMELWQTAFATSVREASIIHGVSENTVRSAMRKVDKLMASEVAMDAASLKLRLHLELETVKREALKAWHRSVGLKKKTKTRTKNSELAEIAGVEGEQEIEVTEVDEAGDPRFLSAVQKAIEGQMDLWPGVKAPKATALTNLEGTEDRTFRVEDMSDEELEELNLIYQANPSLIELK